MIAITVADKNNAAVNTYVPDSAGMQIAGANASFWPQYDAIVDGVTSATVDPGGNICTRGPVLTDEGGFRCNFSNTSIWVDIGTCTATNGSPTVTGTGFDLIDLHPGDYFALTGQEASLVQIESFTATAITLSGNWGGTTATAIGLRALTAPRNTAGGTITIASGQATIASGTTIGAETGFFRSVDTLPLVGICRLSLSQRIANQTFYLGFADNKDPSLAKSYAWFAFDGTTNTIVKGQTGRNPIAVPSASEQQSQNLTIASTATAQEFRIELLKDRAIFAVGNVVNNTNTITVPLAGDHMYLVAQWVNGGSAPATSSNAVLDFIACNNANEVTTYPISREPQPINTAQINGVAPSMGSGTNGTGVQRVTLATDQAACSVAGLFSVKLDQTTQGTTNFVTQGPIAVAAGATTVSAQAALATPNIKATAGNVYGYSIVNKDAAMLYLQFYNSATAPTRGTSVVWWVPVGPSQTVHVAPSPIALNFHSTGIGIAAATTPTGAVAPTTAPDVVVYFK